MRASTHFDCFWTPVAKVVLVHIRQLFQAPVSGLSNETVRKVFHDSEGTISRYRNTTLSLSRGPPAGPKGVRKGLLRKRPGGAPHPNTLGIHSRNTCHAPLWFAGSVFLGPQKLASFGLVFTLSIWGRSVHTIYWIATLMNSAPFLFKLVVLLTTHETTCVTIPSLPWLQLLYPFNSLLTIWCVLCWSSTIFSKFLIPRLKINLIYCLSISCNMVSSNSFILNLMLRPRFCRDCGRRRLHQACTWQTSMRYILTQTVTALSTPWRQRFIRMDI